MAISATAIAAARGRVVGVEAVVCVVCMAPLSLGKRRWPAARDWVAGPVATHTWIHVVVAGSCLFLPLGGAVLHSAGDPASDDVDLTVPVCVAVRLCHGWRSAEGLVLWTRPDGSPLRLGDVATVVDGFEGTDHSARLDFEPTMMVSVFRTGNRSAVEVAALAARYVEQAGRLPQGVMLTVRQKRPRVADSQLSVMLRNGVAGFALVFLVLALCLERRLALWVSLSIPISSSGPSRAQALVADGDAAGVDAEVVEDLSGPANGRLA